MRKGFTLLELLIVIIIVGVMATLGLSQYSQVVERSRGAEARQIIGQLRSVCAAIYMEDENTTKCTVNNGAALGLGGASGTQIPNAVSGCMASHYFRYVPANINASARGPQGINITATRCAAAGKAPNVAGAAVRTISAWSDYQTGQSDWWSPNGY
jgi:prepilin-type N-terminal cleavage/methylation domain-containing protein